MIEMLKNGVSLRYCPICNDYITKYFFEGNPKYWHNKDLSIMCCDCYLCFMLLKERKYEKCIVEKINEHTYFIDIHSQSRSINYFYIIDTGYEILKALGLLNEDNKKRGVNEK